MTLKVAVIDQLRSEYPVALLCRLLSLGTSTYYRHQTSAAMTDDDARLTAVIRQIYHEHRGRYGSPRITADLCAQGIQVNHKRIERLMREAGLRARTRRRTKTVTTDSRHDHPIAPNLVSRQFQVKELNRVWFTDTTCVATRQGWLYVTVVMDGCSKRIVGWAMSAQNDRHMVHKALSMALRWRRPAPGLVLHSDRGSTFASLKVRNLLETWEVKRSMSRTGDCLDNAVIESFFASLKRETDAGRGVYNSLDTAQAAIFHHIEAYYNPKRRHSCLGYCSPNEYEMLIQQA